MQPFLKNMKEGSASTPTENVTREPDEEEGDEHDEDFDSLEVAGEDVMAAVHSKDAKALTTALRAFLDLYEMQPHTEGPHNG